MKNSYVFLAPGFEEIEAVAPIDLLRRAGMPVVTVSMLPGQPQVTGAHGVPYVADTTIDYLAPVPSAEWLILPGGMPGATNLYESEKLAAMLRKFEGNIAAICASPAVVLGQLGLLKGVKATCYPGMESVAPEVNFTGDALVRDGRILTAMGPAFAVDFAAAIIEASMGQDVMNQVLTGMLYK